MAVTSQAVTRQPLRPGTSGRSRLQAQEAKFAWLMISPSFLVMLLIGSLPLATLIVMSFARIDLASTRPEAFVGLDNFVRMLRDDRFWHALRIMLVYTVSSVTLQLMIGLALALALLRPVRGQGVLRVAILLPMILAPVVVGLAWRTLILTPDYGIIDFVVQTLGFGSQPWLTDPTWALVSVIVIHTWQWTPFAFLVFTATLHALPQEPFEAAMIDGAGAWQRFRDLTLPLLWPTIIVIVIMRTMIALRAFDAIFSATGGGPGTATEILYLYAYRVSFTSLTLGYGAAVATVLLVVTAIISALLFRLRTQG
ncbi:MAG: sugar ABC transporter permease [Chloroflexota bacterium]|nr:sugar ABC transporter permease [Chloroflexota bacterium]